MNKLRGLINAGIDNRRHQEWPMYSGGFLDRTKYVTASEVGQCARKTKFNKLAMIEAGYDYTLGTKTSSKDDWGFWERGHGVEGWAVKHIRLADGHGIKFLGEEQVSFAVDVQSGTPDGVEVIDDTVDIVEFKSFDPRSNVNKFPKVQHIDQVMQNLDLVSCEMGLSPGRGHILYIDASNWKRQFEFVIDFDDVHAARLQTRAEWIMEACSPEELPAEGMYTDECKYCGFVAACNAIIRTQRNGESDDQDLEKAAAKFFG